MQLGSGTSTTTAITPVEPALPPFEYPAMQNNDKRPITAEEILANLADPLPPPSLSESEPRNFFERYQLLLSGLLLFGTMIVLSAAFVWNKSRQKKEDLRSIAAALHGELMAARSVCLARLSKIAQEGTERETTWPRIRVIVFQAYIGKLGCLGAELSRQIASIYGMASDYASYYNTKEPRHENASKRQALEALVQYIEEVTPRLAKIEKDGALPPSTKQVAFKAALKAPAAKLSLAPKPTTPSGGPGKKASHAINAPDPMAPQSRVRESLTEAKVEIVAEASKAPKHDSKPAPQPAAAKQSQAPQKKPLAKTARKIVDVEKAAQTAIKAVAGINFKAPILEKIAQMKAYASEKMDFERKPSFQQIDDFTIPDYANLTEEELEALLYAEEELTLASPAGKWQQTG
jgi:hypothetical protein